MYSPVPELNELRELQDRFGFLSYAFELIRFGDPREIEAGLSSDPDFVGRLTAFAYANGSGATYAFWRCNDRHDLASSPVVFFGDDGGEFVVARNLRELLQILGFDAEIYVRDDELVFDRNDERSGGHEEFVTWLQTHLGLMPAEDPGQIVAAAQAELGQSFAEWAGRYLPY